MIAYYMKDTPVEVYGFGYDVSVKTFFMLCVQSDCPGTSVLALRAGRMFAAPHRNLIPELKDTLSFRNVPFIEWEEFANHRQCDTLPNGMTR